MKLIEKIHEFNNSAKGRVIKSILLLVFSLVVITTVTFAWIVSNVSTTSGGMSLNVSETFSYAKYYTYHIDDLDTKEVVKTEQTDANGASNIDVCLRSYDTTFTSVNEYAPIVLEIDLNIIDSRYIPTEDETRYVHINISRNTAVDESTASYLDGVFSSVGQIGCYTSSALSLSSNNKTVYDTIVSQYRSDNSPNKFTTVENGTYSKLSELNIDVAYNRDSLKTDANNSNWLIVYLVLDYSSVLTDIYADQVEYGLGGFSQQIQIDNDLSKINISFA